MAVWDPVYRRLPLWAQNSAITAYGAYWKWLRFGGAARHHERAFISREQFSAEEWQRWQQRALGELLGTARSVPYYARQWSAANHGAASAGVLAELPLLEKEAVRADPDAFVRSDMRPGRRLVFHTSGSTGTPIRSIWTVDELRRSMAVREARSARWAGVSFALPRATFSGRMVEPRADSNGPFYRFNAAERQVYLSPFHLRPDTAARYVGALARHGVRWLTGYAVSYYLLARLILELGLKVPRLDAVVTTSEKVSPEMRAIIEQAYGCRVYEEYSTVENVLFASECGHGSLHVSPDVGIVEILRPDGSPCTPGEAGEVVATCLLRDYQPMIRYRLGDVAVWSPDPCACGRAMPVLKEVVGRIEDVVVGPDGRQLVRFHGVFVDQPHIREGQIVQESIDHIRVRVVPSSGYGDSDREAVVQRVRQRLGADVRVSVDVVERIPRTAAGKFKAVVSHVAASPARGMPA